MNQEITIREAVTAQDITLFWNNLYTYFQEDIFPEPEDESREYFLGDKCHTAIGNIRQRQENPAHFLFLPEKEAKKFCRSQGVSSLTVTCAACDEEMYQHLGFNQKLGTTYACIP